MYVSFSPLPFTSLLFTAICKASSDNHFAFFYFFSLGMVLGGKVVTNLDSILKRRDISLPTKVRLVRAMVFSAVMYGCECWTVKKLSTEELTLLNCGSGEDSCESLELQGDPTSPS